MSHAKSGRSRGVETMRKVWAQRGRDFSRQKYSCRIKWRNDEVGMSIPVIRYFYFKHSLKEIICVLGLLVDSYIQNCMILRRSFHTGQKWSLRFCITYWPSLYLKWVPGIFLGVKGGRRVKLTILPLSVSRMSRRCGSLGASQSYGPSRPIAAVASPFLSPLLRNRRIKSGDIRPISWQPIGKHVPAATSTYTRIQLLLETVFYTRSVQSGCEGRQPYRHLRADCLEDVGASTSHNPMDLHGPLPYLTGHGAAQVNLFLHIVHCVCHDM
jgi:hypothetical protein